MDLCEFRASLVYMVLQDTQNYIMRPCLKIRQKHLMNNGDTKDGLYTMSLKLLNGVERWYSG